MEQGKRRKKSGERKTGRHRFFMRLLRFLVGWAVKWIFKYKPQRFSIRRQPAILLGNHNLDLDPALLGIASRDFMYFVASEHILRWGLASKLIRFVFDPITRAKGTTEVRTAMEILRELRRGNNVALFAEGNRSFNGETGMILPSTGKLVKKSGASLITYRFPGAYLSRPRWANSLRRGLIKGELVGEYSPEEIAAMSDDEVNELIKRDLYVNAFADQKKLNVRYKGKRLAEGIEIVLYLCPNCHRYSTIKSAGDRFSCDCGLAMRYSEYGWLEPDESAKAAAPFHDILSWDRWQWEEMKNLLFASKDVSLPVFFDEGQTLFRVSSESELEELQRGRLEMYRDRFVFIGDETLAFPFDSVHDVEVVSRMNIVFSLTDGTQYEICSEQPRSADKYREGFRLLSDASN